MQASRRSFVGVMLAILMSPLALFRTRPASAASLSLSGKAIHIDFGQHDAAGIRVIRITGDEDCLNLMHLELQRQLISHSPGLEGGGSFFTRLSSGSAYCYRQNKTVRLNCVYQPDYIPDSLVVFHESSDRVAAASAIDSVHSSADSLKSAGCDVTSTLAKEFPRLSTTVEHSNPKTVNEAFSSSRSFKKLRDKTRIIAE